MELGEVRSLGQRHQQEDLAAVFVDIALDNMQVWAAGSLDVALADCRLMACVSVPAQYACWAQKPTRSGLSTYADMAEAA